MSKAGLDNRHRNHDGEISHKHGNALIGTLRKLSQLRRDHETGHLEHKIANAAK
jgi:hypothetical protein